MILKIQENLKERADKAFIPKCLYNFVDEARQENANRNKLNSINYNACKCLR